MTFLGRRSATGHVQRRRRQLGQHDAEEEDARQAGGGPLAEAEGQQVRRQEGQHAAFEEALRPRRAQGATEDDGFPAGRGRRPGRSDIGGGGQG